MTDWDDDILGEDETDDYIIELTDIINEDSGDAIEEEVIELMDIVTDDSGDATEEAVTELTDIIEDETIDFDLDIETEESDEGLEFKVDDSAGYDSLEPEELTESLGALSVTQEQIEAALERVIEKKFTDKIEIILFEVMEKVIEKEIVEIRESLQKDLAQIGNV